MARLLFARGAQGALIADLQTALMRRGFDPKGSDGLFGRDTETAVRAFEKTRSLPETGSVSDELWTAITGTSVPTVEARSLQLTAAFEGHSFTLAQGNWDEAWITWGIIGFTLKHGEIQKIVRRIHEATPDLVTAAFGSETDTLLTMLDAPPAEQEAFANRVSAGSRLVEPWRTHFHTFGCFPEVQAMQCERAHRAYFAPALQTAAALTLTSELGIALCFDIHVQNGSVARDVMEMVRSRFIGKPETVIREAVANGVADHAKPRFREDVRARKLAIARGEGDVHGRHVVLAHWGLSNAPAAFT